MAKDHGKDLEKSVRDFRLSLKKLDTQLMFFSRKINKPNVVLDKIYLDVADEMEETAKRIRERVKE